MRESISSLKAKFRPIQVTQLAASPLTLRVATILLVAGLLFILLTTPVYAQGDQISSALSQVVTSITDIIQSLTVVVGILGMTLWGFGKVARPVFPELSQLTSQYIGQFVIGVVVVFVAATVVEGLVGALGA